MQRHSCHLGNYIVPDCVKGGVAVDIGGNTGQFSLKYKNIFSKIHIYEPQKECYNIITKNIQGVSNIVLYDEAVFHTSNNYVNLVSHTNLDSGSVAVKDDIITVKEWTDNVVDTRCKTIALEDILERAGGRVDYMKIDCETSEYNLLMNKDLSHIRYMGIELHWQMGKENFDRLVKHILQYFNKVSTESVAYPDGYNIEILFESKTNAPTGNSVDHLRFFLGKLTRGEPFSMIRPGDGEYLIITGASFNTQDRWGFHGGSLSKELLPAIQSCATLENCYVGIPCKACCGQEKTAWCIENYRIHPKRQTYANLVCNKNWRPFTSYFIDNKVPFYYIGPGQVETDKLNVLERYYTDPMQIEWWDAEKKAFVEGVEAWVTARTQAATKPLVFAFSVGPLTKILIPLLNAKNPGHFFLDVGSAFDIFLKGQSNRLYITDTGICANVVCDFEKGHPEGHYAPI